MPGFFDASPGPGTAKPILGKARRTIPLKSLCLLSNYPKTMNLLRIVLLAIALIAGSTSVRAQNENSAPEESTQETTMSLERIKEIKKEVQITKSPYYYPELLKRFRQGDSTINVTECYHIYYGFSNESEYIPYGAMEELEELQQLVYNSKIPLEPERVHALAKTLETNYPVGLRFLLVMAVAESRQQIFDGPYKIRFNQILDAILTSGRGTSMEERMYVITTSDEYVVLTVLELDFVGQSLINQTDKMSVNPDNEYGIEALYFDVSIPFSHLSSMMKDKVQVPNSDKKARKNKK